ncbi:MAG: twin-arginine translocase subunit TatB [Burkholderiales bacterium]|nr:MAG: twin-arginine translocase subunit TatB [Burkholderiales bacterium]TAG77395.1 MAG: twin-arginine translocase subunit TatB [Betaproteobacteria bacterium]
MFDFSFGELAIVAVVALVVLGPEKLPKVARTAGHLMGRARAYANQVKSDIDREVQMDELRKLQQQAQEAARSFETAVNDAGRAVESEASKIEQSADPLRPAETANKIEPPYTPGEPKANDEVAALESSIAEQAHAQQSTNELSANRTAQDIR